MIFNKISLFRIQRGAQLCFLNLQKISKFFLTSFALKYLFKPFLRIINDKNFFKKNHFFSMQRVPPFGPKNFLSNFFSLNHCFE